MFICTKCGYEWEYDYIIPTICPKCGDSHIMVVDEDANDEE